MPSNFGYNQLFSNKPTVWIADGYFVVGNYGTDHSLKLGELQSPSNLTQANETVVLVNPINEIFGTTGNGTSTTTSALVITPTSTGLYTLPLLSNWFQLQYASVQYVLPSGGTPLIPIINSFTVGNSYYGYPNAVTPNQGITFTCYNLSGSATAPADGAAFFVTLHLRRTSV
jgi:hypothetical protein